MEKRKDKRKEEQGGKRVKKECSMGKEERYEGGEKGDGREQKGKKKQQNSKKSYL